MANQMGLERRRAWLGSALLALAVLAGCAAPAAPTPTPRAAATPLPTLTRAPVRADSLVFSLAPGVELELVPVPAGEFLMGSAEDDALADVDERPQHTLHLSEYFIGRYEVTVAQFDAFVRATGYQTAAEREGSAMVYAGAWQEVAGADWRHPHGPGLDAPANHPVTQVSWADAVAFCRWVSEVTGRNVRLPTEAEWEKAARGTDGRRYPWGAEAPDAMRCNSVDAGRRTTAPVGHSSPAGDSPYGCADMAGNVWEWTSSYYMDYPYRPDDGREGNWRSDAVLRGGGFESGAKHVRTTFRLGNSQSGYGNHIGFRVCADPG